MENDRPLAGVRVLEFCAVLAGPYAGALLQRLGADVVKVESPNGGDAFRSWSVEGSPHFAQFNTGKRSMVVDLNDERGVGVIRRLLPGFDVLLHNSRPGRMERLGLSGEEALAINPKLVYVGMTGFGPSGPMAARPAYDAIGQSAAGLLGLFAQGRPPFMGPSLGDMSTGIIGASGALTGLVTVGRTGRGVVVETSMLESVIALIADAFTQFAASGAPAHDDVRCRQSQIFTMACSDGRYVATHLSSSDKFFKNLLSAVGREELADDERFATYAARIENHHLLRAELEPVFASRPSGAWEQTLVDADVPTSLVREIGEVLDDPQLAALQLFDDTGGPVPFLRAPWSFDGRRPPVDPHVPRLGEHTMTVLADVVPPDELEVLHAAGVLRTDADYDVAAPADRRS